MTPEESITKDELEVVPLLQRGYASGLLDLAWFTRVGRAHAEGLRLIVAAWNQAYRARFEETIADPGTGRIANATLADYLIPVHADVPDMDVVLVGEPDPLTPIGTKGVGEIGLPGTAAAIANAVYHATGRRIRSLPITIDQLL